MKTKYILSSFIILLFVALSSCTRIDLEDPLKGKITLNTDWSNRTAGVEIPASYTVMIANQTLDFSKPSNTLPELSAGTYPTLIHNTAEKITIQGSTATVATTGDIVANNPGWLFSQSLEVIYENGKEKTVTAVMQQQVRQLTIELTVKEGDANRIQGITSELSGIASQLNMTSHEHSAGVIVVPTFTRVDDKLTAIVRLLGIVGTSQMLTLNLTFADGKTQTIESDLTSRLSDFNTNKKVPLTLTADIHTAVEIGGITATITDWKTQGGNIVIN